MTTYLDLNRDITTSLKPYLCPYSLISKLSKINEVGIEGKLTIVIGEAKTTYNLDFDGDGFKLLFLMGTRMRLWRIADTITALQFNTDNFSIVSYIRTESRNYDDDYIDSVFATNDLPKEFNLKIVTWILDCYKQYLDYLKNNDTEVDINDYMPYENYEKRLRKMVKV